PAGARTPPRLRSSRHARPVYGTSPRWLRARAGAAGRRGGVLAPAGVRADRPRLGGRSLVAIGPMSVLRPLPALEPESEHFWRACREGRLDILRCKTCGWYVHPPRPVCPRCHSRELGWERVSGTGTVVSYTVNHQRWMPSMEVPYVIALVELSEQAGLRLTTNLLGWAPDDVRIGMSVRVRFEPVSDEIALPLFEPDPTAATSPPPAPPRPIAPAIRPRDAERLE